MAKKGKTALTQKESAARQAELYEIAATLLEEFDGPLHYKELCEVLIVSEMWANPWGKEPDQILYSCLHNRYKRDGRNSRILFMGGGMFIHCNVDGADFLELPEPSGSAQYEETEDGITELVPTPKKKNLQTYVEHATLEPTKDKTCGTCTHLSWDGPQEHRHEVGGCSLYAATGRACVFQKTPACHLWKQRTSSQVQRDIRRPPELILEAKLVLAGVHQKSRLP